MVVRIRLARFGKAHQPVYNIVVAQARSARNGKPIEVLGTYDPIPKPAPGGSGKMMKDIRLDTVRAKYWLGVGAQPSDTVWRLMSMFGLLERKWNVERLEVHKEEGKKAWDQKKLKVAEVEMPAVEGEAAEATQ